VKGERKRFTAELAEGAEKRLRKILATDTHRPTRTDRFKSGEAERLKAGAILTLATKSLTEPTKGPEKKQLYSVTYESSVRDKKVIFTGERGENIADYLAVNQPNMPNQKATLC